MELERSAVRWWAALAIGVSVARGAGAQLPGVPVLQGAFPAPGLAVAVNVGHGDDRTMLAGAVGYGPGSGRFGLTAGIGGFSDAAPGYENGRLAYGARAAVIAVRFLDDRLALTPFFGFGSSRATLVDPVAAAVSRAAADTGAVVQADEIPLGVAAGWRIGFSGGRAIALSVAPTYALYRRSGGGIDDNRGAMRVATVVDVALGARLGVTAGAEFGQAASAAEPGPQGARFGLALSFAVARR